MDQHQFEKIFESQVQKSRDILVEKAKQYASDKDRLANFKAAAALQGITPQAALAGMMAKHSYSVYAMTHSTKEFTAEEWDEKITDHVNYLILLQAVLEEQRSDANAEAIGAGLDYLRQQRATGDTPKPTATELAKFSTKNIAQTVFGHLDDSLKGRGYATVAQLMNASTFAPSPTLNDAQWGWRTLEPSVIINEGDEYYLKLPEPVYLGEV